MILEIIRKKPLFFLAIAFSVFILVESRFPEKFPSNDISLQINQDNPSVFLKGAIDSEVDERDARYGDHLASFVLKAEGITKEKNGVSFQISGKAKVYLRNPEKELSYGDEIFIKGNLIAPKGVRNPGGFDQKAYLERKGIRALLFGDRHEEVQILNYQHGNFLREKAIAVKRFLSQSLTMAFERRDAAFLKALFLGERSDLEDDFKDLFIKTGTMHILAVSGFNIGFLSLTLFFLLKPFRISKNIKLWLTLAFVWVYCLLVGWQSPVVRASVMATILIAAQLLGRKPNLLNSLGLAALVILAVNSKQLFDIGFQLSFIAVFAIAQVLPIFLKRPELWPNEKWTLQEKAIHYVKELFWVSFVCLVVTLPITVQNFYIVTPLSLAANMVVVPISFMLFFIGTIFFLTFWWLPKWLSFIPFLVKVLMKLFVNALILIEHFPGAYFIVGKLGVILWDALIVGTIFILWDKRIRTPWVRAILITLFTANIFLIQSFSRTLDHGFHMTVLDVGQGDAIFMEFPHGGNLLIDAGRGGEGDRGRWVIMPFLKSKGVSSIDALVASHPQADHIGGMATLIDEFRVKNFIDAGSYDDTETFKILKEKIIKKKIKHSQLSRGMKVEGFKDIEIQAIHPPRNDASINLNNECLVLRVQYQETSFLLTGDIEEKAMFDILESDQLIKSDVLKVPHHGSRLRDMGEEFVRRVNPRISVISVGDHNAFHHPLRNTLEILTEIPNNRIMRTDLDGAVEIISDGQNLMVKSMHAA